MNILGRNTAAREAWRCGAIAKHRAWLVGAFMAVATTVSAQGWNVELVGQIGGACSAYVRGSLAYIADGPEGLQIIDISDPASPRLRGSCNTSGTAFSVFVSGRLAYVTNWNSGLSIISVSIPESPELVGAYDKPEYTPCVFVSGGLAYVVGYNTGLWIFRYAPPPTPPVVLTISRDDDTTFVSIPPAGYVQHGSIHVGDGTPALQATDFYENGIANGWLAMCYRTDQITQPPVMFTIAYDDLTGVSTLPPAGYVGRGSIHVGTGVRVHTGTDFYENPLYSGWLAMCYRQDQLPYPPVLFLVSHDDFTGRTTYPPTGYVQRGSLHLGTNSVALVGTDFFGNRLYAGWLAMCYRDIFVLQGERGAFVEVVPSALQRLKRIAVPIAAPTGDEAYFKVYEMSGGVKNRGQAPDKERPEPVPVFSEPVPVFSGDTSAPSLIACSAGVAIRAGDTECRSPEMNVWLEAGRHYAIGMEWNGATVISAPPPQKSAPASAQASVTGALSFDSAKGTRRPTPETAASESPYPFALELAE